MAGDKSMEMFALPLLAAAPPQAAVLALAALAIYAVAALRLAEGQYADFYNLAFDFDPPAWCWSAAADPAARRAAGMTAPRCLDCGEPRTRDGS